MNVKLSQKQTFSILQILMLRAIPSESDMNIYLLFFMMIDNSFDMFELKIYDDSYALILKIPYDKTFFVL